MHRSEDELTAPEEGILEAALEELLSGQRPPDLTARILQRAAARHRDGGSWVAGVQNGLAAADAMAAELPHPAVLPGAPLAMPAPPPVQLAAAAGAQRLDIRTHIAAASRDRRYGALVQRRRWLGIAVAASVVAVGLGVGLWGLYYSRSQFGAGPVAQHNVPGNEAAGPVAGTPMRSGNARPPRTAAGGQPLAPAENPFREAPFGAEALSEAGGTGVPWPLPYAVEPQPAERVIDFVDQQLARAWAAGGVRPTSAADDDQWCRRVFQQILGRQPESDELVDFATSTAANKREGLVHRLLYAERYQEELARHWAGVWTTALLGPDVKPANALASREGLEKYLSDALRAGRRHDEIARELISASGGSRPGDPDFNGAVNFVLAGAADKAQLTADVSRIFLGLQGQCAQCHDQPARKQPSGRGMTQEQFWQLAAFFQQATPVRDEPANTVRLANRDFAGATGNAAEAELFYEQPNRQRKIAYPVFLDGSRVSASGRVADVDRRAALAQKIVASEEFAQATVNQIWLRLLGRGLAGQALVPAGQSDAAGPLAELLRGLGEQFAAHDFNQKRLIEWIVLSQANARTPRGETSRPSAELFAQSYCPDDPPAPLYDTVVAAIDDARRNGRPLTGEEITRLGRFAAGAPQEDAGSIFVRSPSPWGMLRPAAHADPFVQQMIASGMTFPDKVEHLFLHALARRPTAQELSSAQQTLAAQGGSIAGALDELWWAIQNSREFAAR